MSDLQEQRLEILSAALKLIPTSGWNLEMLRKASQDLGHHPEYGELLFVEGIYGVIKLFLDQADFYMIDNRDHRLTKISAKVKDALLLRIEFANQHKAVTKRLLSFLALPWNLPFSTKLAWQTADVIWREIVSDTSTDFNFYTKRTTLACIYSNTLLYSMQDEEPYTDTASFLDTQMGALHEFYKIKSKFI